MVVDRGGDAGVDGSVVNGGGDGEVDRGDDDGGSTDGLRAVAACASLCRRDGPCPNRGAAIACSRAATPHPPAVDGTVLCRDTRLECGLSTQKYIAKNTSECTNQKK